MAYPFLQAPTFGEVRRKLEELGCRLCELAPTPEHPLPVRYFLHETEGETCTAVLNYTDDEALVAPWVLRSICVRLRVDPGAFGLQLG